MMGNPLPMLTMLRYATAVTQIQAIKGTALTRTPPALETLVCTGAGGSVLIGEGVGYVGSQVGFLGAGADLGYRYKDVT